MANLLSRATGNWLTASTWGLVDATSYSNSETTGATPPTASGTTARSTAFTTGVITIDAIAVKLRNRTGVTGTLTCRLYNETLAAAVAATSVTINMSDLPAATTAALDGGWVAFQFPSVLLIAATSYSVEVFTSSSTQVSLFAAAGNNWSRMLRTTTQQAPVAGDDVVVAGELTGAGAHNSYTVTMNETVNTDYGSNTNSLVTPSCAISNFGTLAYNGAAATNTYLKQSGHVIVYQNGFLDIANTSTVTMTIASPGVVTWNSHGFENNRKVTLRTTGALPTGLAANTDYYVRNAATNTFELSATSGGTSINTTGSQSGTHTAVTGLPRDSSAILEFDPAADGDMGLMARNGSTVNLQGLSRTSGKNVVSCKLTADTSVNLMQAITLTASALTAAAVVTTLDPTGTSLGSGITSGTFNQLIGSTDTVANVNHKYTWTGTGSVTATTQVFTIWVKRGSGTNNRYIRLQLATATTLPATNGFYADFDLSAVTAGTCTALGNGTATSSAITAFGGGYICTIIGKISSGASVPVACIGACNASTVVSYAGDATQNFICSWPQVYTASAQPTADTVDTDTGWLSGDVVALASTTRTANECEIASLNGNAGASTLTYNLYPVNARSGTSPTQAEVILLTRNVKVRSSSSQIMAYVAAVSGSVVDIDWAEFYYLGEAVSNKLGVEVEVNTTGGATNTSIKYSSLHDFEDGGYTLRASNTAATITTAEFSNSVLWNVGTITGPGCQISGAITATGWTFDSNILIRTGSGNGWTLSDVGGTFTNNTVVGAASIGIVTQEASAIGTMSGNITHACVGAGATFATNGLTGTSTTNTSWRNGGAGIGITQILSDLVLDTPICFGNTTDNILLSASGCDVEIRTPTLSGDTTFSTTNGMRYGGSSGANYNVVVKSGDFSTVSGIKTAHTNDINVATAGFCIKSVLLNTKLGAATEVAAPSALSNNGFIASQKHDQTAGTHKTTMRNGVVQTDTVIFKAASPSLRMIPTSATLKLETAPQFQGIKVKVASGSPATVSVYTRKSIAGDTGGILYAGNQPRLIQKANPALGQNSDVVIATMTVANNSGTWELLSGPSSNPTDDGAFEYVVDCDGTSGAWVNVDDWAISGGIQDAGGLKYWFNGVPATEVIPVSSGGGNIIGD